jgi:hypothetical protein
MPPRTIIISNTTLPIPELKNSGNAPEIEKSNPMKRESKNSFVIGWERNTLCSPQGSLAAMDACYSFGLLKLASGRALFECRLTLITPE